MKTQSLANRLSQAESNLSLVLEQRNQQLEEKHRNEQDKLQRARKAHRRMEIEMEAWRTGLLEHKKMVKWPAYLPLHVQMPAHLDTCMPCCLHSCARVPHTCTLRNIMDSMEHYHGKNI